MPFLCKIPKSNFKFSPKISKFEKSFVEIFKSPPFIPKFFKNGENCTKFSNFLTLMVVVLSNLISVFKNCELKIGISLKSSLNLSFAFFKFNIFLPLKFIFKLFIIALKSAFKLIKSNSPSPLKSKISLLRFESFKIIFSSPSVKFAFLLLNGASEMMMSASSSLTKPPTLTPKFIKSTSKITLPSVFPFV